MSGWIRVIVTIVNTVLGCFQKIGVFPPKWMVKIMDNPDTKMG